MPTDEASKILERVMGRGAGSTEQLPFFIVGIGASAGGLEALETFFDNMPDSPQFAFVVVQHLSPDYKSLMGELLAKHTSMDIHQVEDGTAVEPGGIYLIPRKRNMTIFNGTLYLSDQEPGLNLPIDIFFRSLAADQTERAIGIVLSGTGSDGTRGIRAIKEEGGMVMAQDAEDAKFDGMPRSAAATGIVDFILPADRLPVELTKFVKESVRLPTREESDIASTPNNLNRIFMLIRNRVGVDLSFYKESTLIRRIERRIGITHTGDLAQYISYLEDHPTEVSTLFKEILIGVTKFFRDPEAFEIIGKQILPEIFRHKRPDEPVRVWIAGCSSGEEAYSFAILLSEYCAEHGQKNDIKIFATDIDKDAIEHASYGIYPESIAADADSERLSRYFIRKGEKYQISPAIREMVIFAYHNIFKDPPFRQIDLISCRNLLIYLQVVLQKRVLTNFRFSLNDNGFLVLGSSETVGDFTNFFRSFDAKWKIFQCRSDNRPVDRPNTGIAKDAVTDFESRQEAIGPDSYELHAGIAEQKNPRSTLSSRHSSTHRGYESLYERLIEDYMPPCAIINERREIHHLFGHTAPYIQLPYGRMDLDILNMARSDLSIPLGSTIQSAMKEQKTVVLDEIVVRDEEVERTVELTVKPLRHILDNHYYAVIFRNTGEQRIEPGNVTHYNVEESVRNRIKELENELQYTKENLQATIEELETSNEELQATNEELLSSNEELQSTNEELQSVNEELITVNSEYQKKIEELSELNDDIDNMLTGTDIGTVFLDTTLKIRKFTPPVAHYFSIIKTDIGRPISDLSHSIQHDTLMNEIDAVTETGKSATIEARTDIGSWVLIKVHPYRTKGRSVGGIVLTLIDISDRKLAERALSRKHELLTSTLESSPTAITMVNSGGKIVFANSKASALLGVSQENLIDKGFHDPHFQITAPDGRALPDGQLPYEVLLRSGNEISDREYAIVRSDHESVPVLISGNPIYNDEGKIEGAVLNMQEARNSE